MAMKIVVIGGTGLIGASLVYVLRSLGHQVVSASPASGVNAVTGEGLAEAVAGADALVDVANTRAWDDQSVLDFFVTSSQNLLAAEKDAGVTHHVALSIVGVDRVRDSFYFRAKAAQEDIIKGAGIPFTIVRSTQFFELVDRLLHTSDHGDAIILPPALMQPIAADDVADALAGFAVAPPLNGMIEAAGPEPICLNEVARLMLSAQADPRPVIVDPHARYFGAEIRDRRLMPGPAPWMGPTTFADWLRHSITPD
jgi:uncharacterized protein YbjT (DUF2867 family)